MRLAAKRPPKPLPIPRCQCSPHISKTQDMIVSIAQDSSRPSHRIKVQAREASYPVCNNRHGGG